MGDEIARFDSCLRGRRAVDGGNNFDETLFLRHLDAKSAEFSARLVAHLQRVFRRQVAGVWIKRGKHAVDRGLYQLFGVDLFDVLRADAFKDVAEQIKLFINVAVLFSFLCQQGARNLRRGNYPCQRTAHGSHHELLHRLSILISSEPV